MFACEGQSVYFTFISECADKDKNWHVRRAEIDTCVGQKLIDKWSFSHNYKSEGKRYWFSTHFGKKGSHIDYIAKLARFYSAGSSSWEILSVNKETRIWGAQNMDASSAKWLAELVRLIIILFLEIN